jgi:soluble lytic murein transglycosylase-like protein
MPRYPNRSPTPIDYSGVCDIMCPYAEEGPRFLGVTQTMHQTIQKTPALFASSMALIATAALFFLVFPRLALAEEKTCRDYLLSENKLAYELSVACTVEEKYGHIIEPIAHLNEYDQDLITAVIVVESRGKVEATSHVGAKGLMQLMPKTAKYMGAKDIRDPFENILAGTKYLRVLEDRYGFLSVEEALLAYNMGPRKASEWLDLPGRSATDASYVKKVMGIYGELKDIREKEAAEKEKESAEEFLQKLLLKLTYSETGNSTHAPQLAFARRIEIETKEE